MSLGSATEAPSTRCRLKPHHLEASLDGWPVFTRSIVRFGLSLGGAIAIQPSGSDTRSGRSNAGPSAVVSYTVGPAVGVGVGESVDDGDAGTAATADAGANVVGGVGCGLGLAADAPQLAIVRLRAPTTAARAERETGMVKTPRRVREERVSDGRSRPGTNRVGRR